MSFQFVQSSVLSISAYVRVLLFEYVRAIRNVCFVGEDMWEFLCLGPGKPPMSLFDFKVSNLAEMREHKIRFRYDLYNS